LNLPHWHILGAALLDVLAPEICAACGARRGRTAWAAGVAGPAPGLRSWHATHLCARCRDSWRQTPCAGACAHLPVWGACRESAILVTVIGAWKYRGARGLARPLAEILVPVLHAAAAAAGPAALVPLPLHAGRRRQRGFDQTLQLVSLAGRAAAMPVCADILVRRRATRQQASQDVTGPGRERNVAGAFAARPPRPGESPRLALVDDLLTTGATLLAAAAALASAGWQVAWGAALGLAARLLLDSGEALSVACRHGLAPAGSTATAPPADGRRQEVT
jgi:predicted amidophosphoribosyltransferase